MSLSIAMQAEKTVRVQKAIADRGLASRREAEQWIAEGRVRVNGETVALGDRCHPLQDLLEIDGTQVTRRVPGQIVLAMNKPRGTVSTNRDAHAEQTVFDLLPSELQRLRLSCVGRLDKESEGLLILTNDGDLQQRLAHPSHGVEKIYEVRIDRPLNPADIAKLRHGIRWEGELLSARKVFPLAGRGVEDWSRLEVTLQQGRKREIRRLFYAFGYEVKRLKRIQIGAYRLRGIPRGAFKVLTEKEIKQLLSAAKTILMPTKPQRKTNKDLSV